MSLNLKRLAAGSRRHCSTVAARGRSSSGKEPDDIQEVTHNLVEHLPNESVVRGRSLEMRLPVLPVEVQVIY